MERRRPHEFEPAHRSFDVCLADAENLAPDAIRASVMAVDRDLMARSIIIRGGS